MKKTVLFLLLVCCSTLTVYAQFQDKLTYKFDYGKTSAKNGGGTFLGNNITLRVPIRAGKGNFIIGGEVDMVNISNTASQADANPLETVGLLLGYQSLLGSKNIFVIHAEPMLASDFNQFTSDNFRFKSQALILLNASKKFAFGVGLGYQYQFSGSQLLPLLTTVWKISDHVTLSGILPIIPRLDFKLNDKWSVGGGINGDYSSYRLTAFNNRYVQYRNWSFGVTSKYKPSNRFEIGGLLGIGTRKLEIYNASEKVPLRIYSWNIGGGSYVPDFTQSYKGVAFNFTLAYKM